MAVHIDTVPSEQRPSRRPRALVAGALTLLVVALAACNDSSSAASAEANAKPKSTAKNPGPNPTSNDPGPNDTRNAVVTVDGKLVVSEGCVVLDKSGRRYELHLDDYQMAGDVLYGPDEAELAKVGEHIVVSGWKRDDRTRCGTVFDVDSVNGILP